MTSSTIRKRPGSGRTKNSAIAQSSVSSVPTTLSRAVVRSSGRNASSAALTAGMIRIARRRARRGRSWPFPAETIERMHVHGIEALADAEQEDPDHDQRDQNREGDADLDDERHSLGAGRGEDQPVLDRHEADHLAHRVAPRHHDQQAEQDDRQREGEVFAHERARLGGDRQHDQDRQRDEADAAQHDLPDADHGLDVAMDAEPHDDAVQHDRDHDRLDDEGDRGRDVQVRRVLDVGLPRHRHRDDERMQREDVEQAEHAVLIEQHEAHQHQAAGEHVRDIEGEASPSHASRNEQQQRGEQAEHQRCAEKIGDAEDPHLGDGRLEHRQQEPADRELDHVDQQADRVRRRGPRPATATPQGTNMQPMSDR